MRRRRNPAPALLPATLLLALLLAGFPAAAQPADGDSGSSSLADAEVAFAYGVAAFKRGDFDSAVDELETAAAAAPGDGRIHHWLGLAYLAQGEARRGEAALETALGDRSLPAGYRTRVRSDLDRARSLAAGEEAALAAPGLGGPTSFGELPPWELRLSATYGQDDNPLLLADGAVALLPGGGFVVGPQSDDFWTLGLRGEVRPWRGGDWTLSLRGEATESGYADFGFLDYGTLGATVSLAWGGDPAGFLAGPLGYARTPLGRPPVSLLLQAGWGRDTLDGDTYLTRTELGAAATVNEGRSAATRLSAAWADRSFEVDGSGVFERSGSTLSGGVDQLFFFGRRDRYLSVGLGAWQRDAGAAFDATATEARGELSLPFGSRWRLRLGAARQQVDYDELESNPGFSFFLADKPREDTWDRYSASLTWKAVDRLYVTLGGRWSDVDADVGKAAGAFFDYDHRRAVITANVSWYLLGGGR